MPNLRRTLAGTVAAVLLGVLLVAVPSPSYANARAEVYGPRSSPFGVSYERWLTRWMTWLQEIRNPRNPVFNPESSRNCEVRRLVVFMGPFGTGDRVCNVPRGKVIALTPPVVSECSTAEGNGSTYRKLRRCAVKGWKDSYAHARVGIRIDGERLQHPHAWTFTSIGAVVDLPKNNIWGVKGGPTKSVTRDILFLIKPQDLGRHVIAGPVIAGQGGARWRFKVTH